LRNFIVIDSKQPRAVANRVKKFTGFPFFSYPWAGELLNHRLPKRDIDVTTFRALFPN